jgi:hypothetical protein
MNLIEGIRSQQERVRGLIKIYEDIGQPGAFGAMALKQTVKNADMAIDSGDTIMMLECFKQLQNCE